MTSKLQINDLPPELLAKVFKHLKRIGDRNRAMKVCPLWNSIIDETLGSRKWIGNGSEFWEPNSSRWKPLMEIRREGISHCFFSDIMDELSNFRYTDEVGFRRPNLVHRVEFDGFISQGIYENLLRPLKNLKILSFHISTLSYIKVQFNDNDLIPSLTKLSLTSEGFLRSQLRSYDMEQVFNNFESILNNSFPHLKVFETTLPLFLDKEMEIFMMLSNFICKHCKTLQDLSLKWTFRWRINSRSNEPRTLEEIDAINDGLNLIQNNNSKELLKPGNWKLHSFNFVIEDRRSVCPTALGITEAIFLQTNLVQLCYMCWNYIDIPIDWLKKSCTTLKEISLTVNDVRTPVDCKFFSECINLVKLSLEADGQLPFDDIALAPRLQNPQGLPQSIQCINFRNVIIEIEAVEFISKKLLKLQHLFLTNIGKIENLGMSVPCLLWILNKSPTIKKLKVKGLNDASFEASFGVTDDAESNGRQEVNGGHSSLLSSRDRDLLEKLMDETNMNTKYIPFINKSKRTWMKKEESY